MMCRPRRTLLTSRANCALLAFGLAIWTCLLGATWDDEAAQSQSSQTLGMADVEPDRDYDDAGNFRSQSRKSHGRSAGLPWEAIGPAPPAVQAPVAVHVGSGTVYIATLGAGVLKSTDGGVNFVEVNNGLSALLVASLAMFPPDPDVLYVGTGGNGIYKSVDGGTRWTQTSEATGLAVSIAVDPTHPDIAYAGLQGASPIKKTTDGGATWVNSFSGMPGGLGANVVVWSLIIDPNNPNVLYAATTGNGAWKSTNAGATWTQVDVATSVSVIYLDPADSDIVYAGTDDGVYKSTDAGATFSRVGSPDVSIVLSLVKSGATLYAGTANKGVSVSTDDGATWAVSGLGTGMGLSLSVDGTGAVYAGTQLDGVRRTTDGGADWTRVAWHQLKDCSCQFGYALAIDPGNNSHVIFTANDGGLIESRNGGVHWVDGGRRGMTNRTPRSVAFDPQYPHLVYAGSFIGGGFFRSVDGGRTWTRNYFSASPQMHVTGVDVDPIDHSLYVVFMGQSRGIYKSTDFGVTFSRIDRAVDGGPFLDLHGRGIAVDPNNHTTVYYGGNFGVWQSTDAGATWTRRSPAFATTVTVDPTLSTIVYAGTQTSGVLKSIDGGVSFAPVNTGLPTGVPISRTGGVQVDPRNPDVLYAGTEGRGMFKSVNGGASWFAISEGLDNPVVFGTRIDPVAPDTVYAATTSSVYKTVTGGE